MKKRLSGFVIVLFFVTGMFPAMLPAAQFKVLAVMSYSDEYPWTAQIMEGIDSVLAGSCEVKYIHMNTRKNHEGGPAKAREAYKLYRAFKPDGVIAADDNAQAMFVVPYLKDKVKTPVMFCGVNAVPDKYGYPASHISGILERLHILESLSLLKLLVPSIKNFGYLFANNAPARDTAERIQGESYKYPVTFSGMRMVNTSKEAEATARELSASLDAICLMSMQGLPDENGTILSEKEIIPVIANAFGKPVFGDNAHLVKYGLLCAVGKSGQEQGRTSAAMLLEAMKGTPVSQIPVTRNYHGKQVINATVMRALGIEVESSMLSSVELVRTER